MSNSLDSSISVSPRTLTVAGARAFLFQSALISSVVAMPVIAHFAGMTLAMEQDETADPVNVGLFGAVRQMAQTDIYAYLVEQLWGIGYRGFYRHGAIIYNRRFAVKHYFRCCVM